jgi:excisionase family DNA binding protein
MRRSTMSRRKQFLSTADIARLMSIDVSTVKRWADSGKLQCYKTVGGHRRFRSDQVQALIGQTATDSDIANDRQ